MNNAGNITLLIPMITAARRYSGMGGFFDFGFSGDSLPSTESWEPDFAPWIFNPASILGPDILSIYNAEPMPIYGNVPGYCPGGTYHDPSNPRGCTPYPSNAQAAGSARNQSTSQAQQRGTGTQSAGAPAGARTPGPPPAASSSIDFASYIKAVPPWVYIAAGVGIVGLIILKRRRR